MKRTYIERPFEVKSVSDTGKFTGYGSVFGELDSYRDIVAPGAFKASLAEYSAKNRKVPMLWQHNSREPIGIYDVVSEDSKGLYVEGDINMDVQRGRECHSLMKQGALSGLSIGYSTINSTWDEKNLIRTLNQVDLFEISPVTFPALDSGRVDTVKSIEGFTTLSECEDYLRDAGWSRKEAMAFIARVKATGAQSDSASEAEAKSITAALQILRNS